MEVSFSAKPNRVQLRPDFVKDFVKENKVNIEIPL